MLFVFPDGNDPRKQAFDRAFEQIVLQYEKLVFHTAYGFLRNEEDARDITQTVFLKVYRGYASFKSQSKPETWLYAICKNAVIDFVRKRNGAPVCSVDDEDFVGEPVSDEPVPEELLLVKERRGLVWDAIGELPEGQREVLILRDMEEYSTALVADMLCCDEGTVKSRLFRARKNLKKILDSGNYFDSVPSHTSERGGADNGKHKKRGKKKGQ